jgi:N6-L-threonylcarbamoyladenine synthase
LPLPPSRSMPDSPKAFKEKGCILGIESTAHTFGTAVIDEEFHILADVRHITPLEPGKGIHPKKAAEHHSKVARQAISEALVEARISARELAGVAYSAGPGLGPALRIGATAARVVAAYLGVPLFPVHHGLGHIELALRLAGAKDPIVVLVSGGHTAITGFSSGRWRIYGETLDITLGNLLDQFARSVDLPSPGGPEVERLAGGGGRFVEMPYTVKGNNVVYSGLLTYALSLIDEEKLEDLCYSIQETAFAMLTEATERAYVQLKKEGVVLAGGVAPNRRLQEMMDEMVKGHDSRLLTIGSEFHGDNGVQIALVGMYLHLMGMGVEVEEAFVRQRWRLDEVEAPWRL